VYIATHRQLYENKERRHMKPMSKVRVARIAGVAFAVGGLTGSVALAGVANAATVTKISTAKNATLGTILVSGKTVYTLQASSTPCTAMCLKFWPAVTLPKGVTKAQAGAGVNAAKLGTKKMSTGALQVTYGGKPLYFFVQDKSAGQVTGNVTDTWGKWSTVVTVKPTSSSSGSGTTAPSGGGSTAGSGGVSF
jgi:predicted lipoprotein with Yx(FWY)xxD motif